MRYAFMTFSAPDADADTLIDLVKQHGYDGIEPRLGSGHAHGIEIDTTPAQRNTLRQQFENAHVAIACIATSCRFANPEHRQDAIEEGLAAIQLAHDLGCPGLRIFGGPLAKGQTHDQAIPEMVDALQHLADAAEPAGVWLGLETHDDWSEHEHMAKLIRQVDRPSVCVNWDFMHPLRIAHIDISTSFEGLRPWIKHVHVHDAINRLDKLDWRPIGQGDFDHAIAMRLLHDMNYDGWVSGEWIGWEPADVHLPRERETLRALEASTR